MIFMENGAGISRHQQSINGKFWKLDCQFPAPPLPPPPLPPVEGVGGWGLGVHNAIVEPYRGVQINVIVT